MTPIIRRGYVDSLHGQLHYRMARPPVPSRRPPLLCLHQTPLSGWDWEPIIPGLARERVVFAPDTPGYGASDPPPEPATIGDYARVMMRFMDDMQASGDAPAGPFDVIGYHTGSIIGAELAKTWSGRVRRLVVIGLAAYDAANRAAKLANVAIFPTPTDNTLSHVTRLWSLMSELADPRAGPAWRHAQLVEGLRPGARLPSGFAAVYRYDFLGSIPEVRQPTLIIRLEDDLFAVTEAAAGLFPNGRRVDILGAAHGVLALEPERMVGLVTDFLDG